MEKENPAPNKALHLSAKSIAPIVALLFERLLESVDDPDRLAEVGEWLIDCDSGDAFLARVREWAGQGGA